MLQHTDLIPIPDTVLEITANRCRLLDRYVLFQTGTNEFTALIQDPVSDKVSQLKFWINDQGLYTVLETEGTWEYTVYNEYYTYSNLGFGSALDLPVFAGIQSYAAVVLTVCLMFLVVFRSLLFPFRKRNK